MKGYFSQLARHTGLHFRGEDSKASRTQAIQAPAPLHVDEIAFVPTDAPVSSITTSDAPVSSASPKPVVPQDEPAEHSTLVPFSAPLPVDVSISTTGQDFQPPSSHAIGTDSVRIVPTEQPSISSESNVAQDQKPVTPVEKELERVEVAFLPPTIASAIPSQTRAETKVDSLTQPLNDDAELSDPVEREVLVRQYLREVRAWVAASPAVDVAESEAKNDWQPQTVAVTVEREPTLSPAQSPRREQLDVHDMNLSIGTISVVVEDPKPPAPVIVPTPSALPPQPQTQPEPTSLSRYYLRAW